MRDVVHRGRWLQAPDGCGGNHRHHGSRNRTTESHAPAPCPTGTHDVLRLSDQRVPSQHGPHGDRVQAVATERDDETLTLSDSGHTTGRLVVTQVPLRSLLLIAAGAVMIVTGAATWLTAEVDREDPKRATVMNGSFLRASLFTSVVSFGVAAMALRLGLLVGLIGYALYTVAKYLTVPAPAAPVRDSSTGP
jgi:hypothetical protein